MANLPDGVDIRIGATIVRKWHVLVRLPKDKDRGFDTWATVDFVVADSDRAAIREAVKRHGSEILEYVSPTAVAFLAIPHDQHKPISSVLIDSWVSGHGDLHEVELGARL